MQAVFDDIEAKDLLGSRIKLYNLAKEIENALIHLETKWDMPSAIHINSVPSEH